MTSIAILEAVNTTAVQFHGQPIITAMVAGVAYVAMRPLVENIGIDWTGQSVKLRNQKDKFNCRDISMVAADGKLRQLLCLPLKKLNGWLFSINPEKVRADIRDKLIQYQEECFTVLHDYWNKGVATNPRKTKTAPGKITQDQQMAIKELVKSRGQSLPKEKQAKAMITMWSAIKNKFGITYKEIDEDQFTEALSLVSRLPLDGEYIEAPKAESTSMRQLSAQELDSLVWLWDYANRAQAVFRELYMPMRQIQSKYSGKCHDYACEFSTVINNARDILKNKSHEIDAHDPCGPTNTSAWKRLQDNDLPPSFSLR